jgi:hypothetical protein
MALFTKVKILFAGCQEHQYGEYREDGADQDKTLDPFFFSVCVDSFHMPDFTIYKFEIRFFRDGYVFRRKGFIVPCS